MTPERWQKIKDVFSAALETPTNNRAAFVNYACASDGELASEVESLLRAHKQPDSILEDVSTRLRSAAFSAANSAPVKRAERRVGMRIGAYRLLELLGTGGMGDVYKAVRDDDQYRAEVAIKLMRIDLDGDVVEARFKAERQILATLEHRNIARLLDGGTTDEGAPYVVMELVKGRPITHYCDELRLGIHARVELFLQVCAAIDYAHQRLIVHRDLKPSNILVTDDGSVKLLDFGIAKILDQSPLAKDGALTEASVRLMTPAYSSPEQFRGDAVTTATDVYALGLILYELLSGSRAFHATGNGSLDDARAILLVDPEKPSARVKTSDADTITVSELRSDTPQKLRRRLSGDLDAVVMKSIRKEPNERYRSADVFAEDLRRYLRSEPVTAHKGTARYLTRKFIVRHRVAVAAVTAVLLSIVIGLIATLRESQLAHRNEQRAERRAEDVRRLANTLLSDVNDSVRDLPGSIESRKQIVEHAQKYLEGLAKESSSDPVLLSELSTMYRKLADIYGGAGVSNLGDHAAALENYRKSMQYAESAMVLRPQDPDLRRELADRYQLLSGALLSAGNDAEARRYLDQAVALSERLAKDYPHDEKMLRGVAATYLRQADLLNEVPDFQKALVSFQRALAIYEEQLNRSPEDIGIQHDYAVASKRTGAVLIMLKQYPEALALYRQAGRIDEALLALEPNNVGKRLDLTFVYSDTGYILQQQKKYDDSFLYYKKALDERRALSLADPKNNRVSTALSNTLNALGGVLNDKGQYADAIPLLQESLTMREAAVDANPDMRSLRYTMSLTERNLGRSYLGLAKGDRKRFAENCRQSLHWNERARRSFDALRAQKATMIPDAWLVYLESDVAQCGGKLPPSRY